MMMAGGYQHVTSSSRGKQIAGRSGIQRSILKKMNDKYYISKVLASDTCMACGFVIKESKTKTKVVGCPIFKTLKQAQMMMKKLVSKKLYI